MRFVGWLIASVFLSVAPALSQATASPPDVSGHAGDWWWIVLIILLIGTAVWFLRRRRGTQ